MKNDLKISVIRPAYNAEKYLTATLDSVVSQTMPDSDYEIIIVNDGSSDHTADILEKYKNLYSNITVINKENGGPSSARNTGLATANGKYIYFFDADDLLINNALEAMFTKAVTESADLVIGTYDVLNTYKLSSVHTLDDQDALDDIDKYTKDMFFDTLTGNLSLYKSNSSKVYKEGVANGVLFGGNLSTLASLCGVDFIPDNDFILFIEDWHDPTYKIDRMLTQLLNIKHFEKNIKGIVVGEFLSIEEEHYFDNIFYDIAERLDIPIASGFKISHGKQKITLPYGIKCKFDAKVGEIKILEDIFVN